MPWKPLHGAKMPNPPPPATRGLLTYDGEDCQKWARLQLQNHHLDTKAYQ